MGKSFVISLGTQLASSRVSPSQIDKGVQFKGKGPQEPQPRSTSSGSKGLCEAAARQLRSAFQSVAPHLHSPVRSCTRGRTQTRNPKMTSGGFQVHSPNMGLSSDRTLQTMGFCSVYVPSSRRSLPGRFPYFNAHPHALGESAPVTLHSEKCATSATQTNYQDLGRRISGAPSNGGHGRLQQAFYRDTPSTHQIQRAS